MTGPLDHRTGLDRLAGFRAAVEAAGIADASTVIEGDFSEESGATAADALVAAGSDGALFANDDMAFGALAALRRLGAVVPDDLSVCGFDDFGLARLTSPALTTVHVPAERMSIQAAETLFALIDGQAAPPRDPVRADLVVRESCGCVLA